ncbi:MAG: hypothetical protein ACOX4V_07745 [Anaerovoracaceae bacterium]
MIEKMEGTYENSNSFSDQLTLIDCTSGAAVKEVYNKTIGLFFEEGGG